MGNAALYRFMDKVNIEDGLIKNSPCWIWQGAKSKGGGKRAVYGSFRYEGKTIRAHVFASREIRKQELPKGFERHHICEDTLCVCPEHIEIVTQQQNNIHRWHDGYNEKLDFPPFFKE